MKTTLLPTLLLTCLLFGSLAPVQAQTTLLKIDYQNTPVFHVLDDGRLLLPTGAADGYVLTADSDGYATWQAASGTGGLSVVSSDGTLTGEGTAASPLGVTVPLVLTGSGAAVVRGEHSNGNYGRLGSSGSGVFGHGNGNDGYLGTNNYGVYGNHSNGNFGYLGGSDYGVLGANGFGHEGHIAGNTYAVFGRNGSGNIGYLGGPDRAVYGENISNGTWGYLGGTYGAYGRHDPSGNYGRLGTNSYGVFGKGESGYAGYFAGDVHVMGTLSKGGGSFKIDHPLDPEGKYLSHSFVESPDMMNVYNGNVITDANGEAVVTLPDYFEALNRDFRYQLTAIGAPGPNLYVAEEIAGNRFKIAGGQPGMKVSWQVTGIRQDAWAEENRIIVEEDKPAEEQGFYLHPRLFGQPQERSILQAEAPEDVRTIQEMPPRLETEHPRVPRQQ